MNDNRVNWAVSLQQLKLDGLVSIFLEAMGPLTVLIAQLMYVGEPVLSWTFPKGQWVEIAKMLENQEDTRHFSAYLKEEAWK